MMLNTIKQYSISGLRVFSIFLGRFLLYISAVQGMSLYLPLHQLLSGRAPRGSRQRKLETCVKLAGPTNHPVFNGRLANLDTAFAVSCPAERTTDLKEKVV